MQFIAKRSASVVVVAEFGNNAVGQLYLHRDTAVSIDPTAKGTSRAEWDLSPGYITVDDNPAGFFLNVLPTPQDGSNSPVTITVTQNGSAVPSVSEPSDPPGLTNPAFFGDLPPNVITRIDLSILVRSR